MVLYPDSAERMQKKELDTNSVIFLIMKLFINIYSIQIFEMLNNNSIPSLEFTK